MCFKKYVFICLIFNTLIVNASAVRRSLRMGDRFYISSILNTIFGETAKDIIYQEVIRRPDIFSGPCVLMEEIYYEDKKGDPQSHEKNFECLGGRYESKIPMYNDLTSFRVAHVAGLCRKILKDEKNYKAFLVLNSLRDNDGSSTERALKLFYPNVVNVKLGSHNDLKKFIFQLCSSTEWQIP